MKRKWMATGAALALICAMAIPLGVSGAVREDEARLRPDFTIVIDGQERNFKRADGSAAFALVYEDSTYLPLRAIGEALGKNVNWDEKTKTITLEGTRTAANSSNREISGRAEDVTVQVRDDFTIVIDGKEQTFRTSAGKAIYPLLYDGSTYLPLRAIGQIMDKDVSWDNATKTVTMAGESTTVTDADSFSGTTGMTASGVIDIAKAKEIALQDAGLQEKDVTFVTLKTDREDGRQVYEVEFYAGGTEYDYEIDVQTGAIVSFDKDFEGTLPTGREEAAAGITAERAKEIALRHAGLAESDVRRLKVETDRDHGVTKYEIEFQNGRMEYEYEINAETGDILKAEKEYDD